MYENQQKNEKNLIFLKMGEKNPHISLCLVETLFNSLFLLSISREVL